jgi:hypothetical protein
MSTSGLAAKAPAPSHACEWLTRQPPHTACPASHCGHEKTWQELASHVASINLDERMDSDSGKSHLEGGRPEGAEASAAVEQGEPEL